jgi:hypothetical protein
MALALGQIVVADSENWLISEGKHARMEKCIDFSRDI